MTDFSAAAFRPRVLFASATGGAGAPGSPAFARLEADVVREELARRCVRALFSDEPGPKDAELRFPPAGPQGVPASHPTPLLLVRRLFPPDLLERRIAYLKLMEWFPKEGAPLVVQGGRGLLSHAAKIARAVAAVATKSGLPVLLVAAEPGDFGFLDALGKHLPEAFRLPPEAMPVDVVAVLANAKAVLGESAGLLLVSTGVGTPGALVAAGKKKLPEAFDGLGPAAPDLISKMGDFEPNLMRLIHAERRHGPLAAVEANLDAHFDALARETEAALAARLVRKSRLSQGEASRLHRDLRDAEQRVALLQRAYDALSQRVADQRLAIAEEWENREAEAVQNQLIEAARLREAADEEGRRLTADLDIRKAEVERLASTLEGSQRALKAAHGEGRRLTEDLDIRKAEVERLASTLEGSQRALEAADEEGRRLRANLESLKEERDRFAEQLYESRGALAREGEAKRGLEEAAARLDTTLSDLWKALTTARDEKDELERLRPDHEQLTKFHWMVLAEVDALLNDKRVLASRLADVEAERDAARQNAERVSAALAAQAAQLAQVRAEFDVLHSEFVRFTHLRLFRYTAPLRAVYGQVRRLLGLKRP